MESLEKNILDYSSLDLAYLGDAIWELEVRKYFLRYGYKINKLNKCVKMNVNAISQSKFLKIIFDELSDSEKQIVKRAKNSNIKSFPKSCSVYEYKEATAFEALIAYLYINKEYAKIQNIILKCLKGESNNYETA